jgi:hypothetical protein
VLAYALLSSCSETVASKATFAERITEQDERGILAVKTHKISILAIENKILIAVEVLQLRTVS